MPYAKRMNRSLILIIGALALGAGIFAGAYCISHRASAICCANRTDALGWLRSEYHLKDAEMARLRQMQEAYMPQCAKMCALVEAKNAEIQATLAHGTNVDRDIGRELADLGLLRAQCQEQMLRYFMAVSQAMPPEEGRRYLAEMEKSTLGYPSPMVQAMSDSHERGIH